MNENYIHSNIITMEADVQKLVQQRTLETYTEGPSISRARLFFLLLPEFDRQHWSEEITVSANTVAIVYAALHAHDLIKENGPATKEQQLTVLAGDFYSGIYYQLLANLKNIDLIRDIAAAIITVSENKASLYEENTESLADLDRSVQSIEAALIHTFYRFYEFDQYMELAQLSLAYLRYSEELAQFRAGGSSPILKKLNKCFQKPAQLEGWLSDKLDALQFQISKEAETSAFAYAVDNYLHHQIIPHRISIKLSN